LRLEDYNGKRVLDIGCGPMGSLEWADMTARRVGLDPLARSYLTFGADQHKMEYVASGSERIPFDDGYFDVVSSLNSLDHVNDVYATIKEIKRVVRRGGLFLLMVEINHPPTVTEPITINEVTLQQFKPEFKIVADFKIGMHPGQMHEAALNRSPPYVEGRSGIYVAKYVRG